MGTTACVHVARVRTWERDPQVRVVEVEGVGTFRLDARTLDALGLREGLEIDDRLAGRIRDAARRREGRAVALRLLQRRLRSRAELETSLRRRGLSRLLAVEIISGLAREGWIDDSRFAQAWVRDRLALRPSGRRRLRAELLFRGISPTIADDAIASMLTPEGEEDLALAQARARFRRIQGLPPPIARRRLVGWLRRRGFGSSAISRVLKTMGGATSEDEDDARPTA